MTRRAARGLLIYALVVLLLASAQAWRVHSAPFDCADDAGHGPDPGTRECDSAIAHARARRPEATLAAFIAIVIFGAMGAGAYGAIRVSLRLNRVRRVADR